MKQQLKHSVTSIKRELRQNHEQDATEIRHHMRSKQQDEFHKQVVDGSGSNGFCSRSGSLYSYDEKAHFSRRNALGHRDNSDEQTIYAGRSRWNS
ncbi:MAG TPA: hypothetical protein VLB84_12515 [Bacteroidia bacterium]|nr:hypothetical protein [Bacteroidia bacterium]